MRLSQLFGRTLREAPADASLISHRLAMRAGLARPLSAGVWGYLPLGWRVMRRIEALVRAEMAALGAQELRLPAQTPVEAALASLCAHVVESYKDLPRAVFHFAARARPAMPARGGLFGLREYMAAEAVSLHADSADRDAFFERARSACLNVVARCGLAVEPAEAEGGASQVFMLPHPEGEERLARCAGCGYAATLEWAAFERGAAQPGDPLPAEKVATPDCKTIADLCAFLGIGPERTLKVVFYAAPDGQVVMALVRGDLEVSQAKLAARLGGAPLLVATEEQVESTGAVAGYASPIGLAVRREGAAEGLTVIADESLRGMVNFVTGANEAGYHAINANHPRDFAVSEVADIAEAYDGAACARCGGALAVESAFRLGHCSRPGAAASQAAGAAYLDAQSRAQPVVLGSHAIELDRVLAAAIEAHHDQHGIIWPRAIAPFDVHLVSLVKDEAGAEVAERLYADLQAAGFEALYDDRKLSPGVMFADADLIGAPLRLTVSARSLESGGVEAKWRSSPDREVIPLGEAIERAAALLAAPPEG